MESNIIIFDFEVFKHETLLGCIIIDNDNNKTLYQTWDLDEIREFYHVYKDNSIWIGWNNSGYDNFILQAIVQGKDPKKVSDDIIDNHNRFYKLNIDLYYYDLMSRKPVGLKVIEAFTGKNISETEVDFDLNRKLTQEERELTESYNRDDLNQTLENFNYLRDDFDLRIGLLSEFKIPLKCLSYTEAMLAARVLHARRIDGIEYQYVNPMMYDNLQIKNQRIIDFYMNREWAEVDDKGHKKRLVVNLCGTDHTIASGGIHGAEENCKYAKALYIDVSGYYNLVMILKNLLPRSIPFEYKKVYEDMYHAQLAMKKTNPKKRQIYKTILLAVFGAQNQEYSDFYDPHQGDLVRMTGQMFLVDLLEKLEGYVKNIQSNTDGIMIVPLPGVTDEQVLDIVNEWIKRTGFDAKIKTIFNLVQRDVNNYLYQDEDGNIEVKGEAMKHFGGWEQPFVTDGYMSKEPLIIHECLVNYLAYGKSPEEIIEKNKDNLRLFQYICKKGTFDWMEYEEIDSKTGMIKTVLLQKVNRAFALKSNDVKGVIYKRKHVGKVTKSKYSNLPDNCFVYNDEILSENSIKIIQEKIDYDYYVLRAYERISEFL